MNSDHAHTDRVYLHLSEEDLYRYLEGTLGPEERKRREAHLKDCELCADMLEGFESAGGLQAFRRDMEALRATIREKTQARKKKSILFDQPFSVRTVVALAACLLAAVALSMFLFLQKEDFTKTSEISLAKKQQVPNSDGAVSVPEEAGRPTPDQSVVADESEKESKVSEPSAARSEQELEPAEPSKPSRDAPIVVNKNAPPQTLGDGVLQQPAPKDKEFDDVNEESAETVKADDAKSRSAYTEKVESAEVAAAASGAKLKTMSLREPQPEGGYEVLTNYLQTKLASLGAALSSEKVKKQQSTYGGKTRAAEAIGKRAYFYVEPDGKLTDFEITGETDKQRVEKIIEALRKGPAWKPAYKNGKPVRQRVSVPIDY